MMNFTDLQKIGLGLTGFGVAFIFLGIIMLLDRGLLALGNILFLSGLTLVIGLEKASWFFFQRHKLKGTCFFLGGVLIVLFGWTFVGIIIEMYGSFILFSGFLSVVVNFMRNIPVVGRILYLPGISHIVNWIGEPQGLV